uniref:Glucosidase 2 subunit beta n=1 Tax=Strongyloides venezuelensis TaxID=75913 RepID=A0A0K0G0D5_STRVS
MNKIVTIVILLFSVSFVSSETNRPRGVSLQDGHLYDDTNEKFQCLDGSKTIPFEAVNDDYCDCKDGSDEPGTSACPNGQFYCINKGYTPKTIPSSMVNDNICDCCDGSDEWDSSVTCPNMCDTLGAEAREKAIKKMKVIKEGWEKRKELVVEGEKIYLEQSDSITSVKEEVAKLKEEKEKLENELKPFEEKEKELKDKADKVWNETVKAKKAAKAKKMFEQFDISKDGKITLDEIKKIPQADSDNNKEVTDDEAKAFFGNNEEVDLEKFTNDIYDIIKHDMRYKRSVDESAEKPKEEEDGEKEGNQEEQLGNEGEYTDSEKDVESESHKEDDHEHQIKSEDEDEYENKPEYDEETKAAIADADKYREKIREISDKMNTQEDSIRNVEKFLEINFGEDKAWASLFKKCFEITQKQYVYKVCLFERTSQKDSNGYGETSLGNWENWLEQDTNPFKIQSYTNGQSCWNGPNRSTKVVTECGQETELVDATEPSKCEYVFTLKSPIACPDPSTVNLHDEL